MMAMKFTASFVQGLKAKAKPYEVFDDSGERGTGRLGVRVNVSGMKTFIFRYFRGKERVYLQIGILSNTLGLSEARKQARQFGAQLKKNIDPKQHLETLQFLAAEQETEALRVQQEAARQGSLQQLFHGYTAQMKKDGKRTYEATLKSLEKEVYPFISEDTKAKEVTVEQIINVLAGIIERGAETQSNRVRSYLMAAFNYGMKHDHDPAHRAVNVQYGLKLNPVTPVPKQRSAERVGENWLTIHEVRLLLQTFADTIGVGFDLARLLDLCFYSGGQRPYELAASKWSAVNWESATLEIIPAVSKNKRHHMIPLNDKALATLRAMHEVAEGSDYIFPHRLDPQRHIRLDSFSQCINRFVTKSGFRHFVPRDIRRTCKTLMGEMGISKHLRDRIHNHALQDVSSKHYDRYEYLEEKRVALDNWVAWLEDKQQSNVRSFRVS
jgi:integrase